VRTYWEKQLDGPIIWYGATLEMIGDYLEKLEAASNAASAANAPIG